MIGSGRRETLGFLIHRFSDRFADASYFPHSLSPYPRPAAPYSLGSSALTDACCVCALFPISRLSFSLPRRDTSPNTGRGRAGGVLDLIILLARGGLLH